MFKLSRLLHIAVSVILTLGSYGLSVRCEASPIIIGNPFSAADQLGLSPFWDWKTIETENFRVIFPAELNQVANQTAQYLEEAHRLLSPLLRWQPHYKTQVLVIDNSDSANGLTAPIVRIGITLWVTPPESWNSTYYYDNWLRLLVIHEYTHFLNMDSTHGYAALGRYIFGDAFLPSSLWTPWMLEGLAVYMETRFTSSGRGRSPYYEMVLRAAVEENVLGTRDFLTLDKINGTNPYFPGGDTRYQFGYHLMNQISKQALLGTTADKETETVGGDDILGILSDRSSHRIPFLTNENLDNVIGKNWAELWDEMIIDSKKRANEELTKIHAQPTTQYTPLTQRDHLISNNVLGSAASPDGNWLAYTLGSADRRYGLYLQNLKTGITRRLDDKLNGVGMKFTPDSKAFVYSEFRQKNIYYTYSDLRIYVLDQNTSHALTSSARARDPDISRDGHWTTFTITDNNTTGLALAPFIKTNDDYELGAIEKLYMPTLYGHVANPQFSIDGKQIYFTLHLNGKAQEDLMSFDLASHKVTALVSDGFFNQYPAVDGKGELYFVSTKTGVHNLFHYQAAKPDDEPEMVTNMTTGILTPSFTPSTENSSLYACVFSTSGWGLAKIDLSNSSETPSQTAQPEEHSFSVEKATIALPPAPPVAKLSELPAQLIEYPVNDYSIFPSILPRAWTPLVGWDANGLSAGAEVMGFDAVNRHRYVLAGSYSTQLQTGDGFFLYSNRTLGPEVSFTGDYLTTNVMSTLPTTYTRQLDLTATVTYPILWTYSSLTPSIAFDVDRLYAYQIDANTSHSSLLGATPFVSSIAETLSFSNRETSNLGISYEGGRLTQIGLSTYLVDSSVWKGLLIDREYIRIAKHVSLSPSFKAQYSSSLSSTFPYSDAVLAGRNSQVIVTPFTDSFNQLAIRGYPGTDFFSRLATVTAVDLSFPITRVFGGWDAQPAFLDNLYGFTFAELSYFPYGGNDYFLPSAGGGIRLSAELFSIVTSTVSLEYHKGFRQNLGGANDLFVQLFVSALSF